MSLQKQNSPLHPKQKQHAWGGSTNPHSGESNFIPGGGRRRDRPLESLDTPENKRKAKRLKYVMKDINTRVDEYAERMEKRKTATPVCVPGASVVYK